MRCRKNMKISAISLKQYTGDWSGIRTHPRIRRYSYYYVVQKLFASGWSIVGNNVKLVVNCWKKLFLQWLGKDWKLLQYYCKLLEYACDWRKLRKILEICILMKNKYSISVRFLGLNFYDKWYRIFDASLWKNFDKSSRSVCDNSA